MASIHSFTTSRREGPLRDPVVLRRFLIKHGWPATVATAEQVHRARIDVVPRLQQARCYPGADGLLTAVGGQPLGIFTADCVPVFLATRDERVVGVLHAGWRGVVGGIFPRAVRLIRRRWGIPATQVRAWAGPAIGRCCFEVQWDVARHFPRDRRRRGKRWMVDLSSALRRQARRAGARWIPAPASCTMHSGRYFSFRRQATADRQVSLIMKKEKR